MKKLIFILILLSTFVMFAGGERLAILEFVDQSGKLSKQTLKNAEITLRTNLARKSKGRYQIISPTEQKAAIVKMRKESHGLDRDESYRIALGKTLSAAKIIYTTILFIDAKTYKINCELTNIETEQLENGADEIFNGSAKSLDEAVIKIVKKLLTEDEEEIPAKPKKSEDQIECENASTENTAASWKAYLEFYPRGICAKEAKEKLDEIACQQALRANTIQALEEYLDNFNGKCKVEARKNIFKLQDAASKSNSSYNNPQNQYGGNSNSAAAADTANTELVGNREWSELSEKKMNFREAKNYCRKLRDNGNSDWRLPTIDELRTLIKSCPATETFGACKVSEAENCLSYACLSDRYCECGPNSMGEHSKLEDTAIIWSSSSKTGANDSIFIVDFLRGGITTNFVETRNNVRCTR